MSEYVCPHPEHHTDLNMYCECGWLNPRYVVAETVVGRLTEDRAAADNPYRKPHRHPSTEHLLSMFEYEDGR